VLELDPLVEAVEQPLAGAEDDRGDDDRGDDDRQLLSLAGRE